MAAIGDYEKQVYAGVLGKVIGVYMGRPIENWRLNKIQERFGLADRYLHEEVGVPLVVADDDISGTFTFVRALEDSGLYADTPPAFFGDAWLDYLIENRTVLWWGGMGFSTEHTAYMRLKNGYKSPASGSAAVNGKVVSEQIGGQIFIDAFGMVAPGKPKLAASLARRAAGVSHDGEAVNAAVVVAGMVAAAFVEKDMNKLLDIGVSLIPENSLIARIHRDVRAWVRRDRDWRKTFARIQKKYGVEKYDGGCHVVPNHAAMVLAWAAAPDDFYQSQVIINSVGWDTDCNAANVGSVMGIKVGLERICERYDFISPFADRIYLPTADGTRSISDCLIEAGNIARIGRKVMGWPAARSPKGGAWHHFSMPGAMHGYMPESHDFKARGNATVENVVDPADRKNRVLKIAFKVDASHRAMVSTPISSDLVNAGYGMVGTPKLYPGMTVTVEGRVGAVDGKAQASLFFRAVSNDEKKLASPVYSRPQQLKANNKFEMTFAVPDFKSWPVRDFGVTVESDCLASGKIFIDRVTIGGRAKVTFPVPLPTAAVPIKKGLQQFHGWINDGDYAHPRFCTDREEMVYVGKNQGVGVMVTGTTDWRDYTFSARVRVHMADRAGVIVRYRGLLRYLAVVYKGDKLQLVSRHYTETVLASTKVTWKKDVLHELKVVLKGRSVVVYCAGREVLRGQDEKLLCGGAGVMFENGVIGFRDTTVS